MNKSKNSSIQDPISLAVDVVIKITALFLLLIWCFQIIQPFISIVFWALIITVTLYPLFKSLTSRLGKRKKLASAIITLVLLSVLIVPSILFTESMVEGTRNLSKDIDAQEFKIPPPTDEVAGWPLIGNAVHKTWLQASTNLDTLIMDYTPQLKSIGSWVLNALMGTGLGFIQLLISIIIAGIFLVYSDPAGKAIRNLFKKIVGSRGTEFATASEVTIRNVSKGVLGVAVIQAILAGVVFLAAGVPYAGLWALVALIFCIIQLGPGLVIIPVIIYLFSVDPGWLSVIWTILLIFVMISDNILKPILMGKGAPVPMLVIFIGSIGGFMASGFIGLFLGAIILSLGYKLFLAYINGDNSIENVQP